MQNNPTLSTNKIIVLVVFICAAIMTSVFVYHLRQKPPEQPLTPEEGMMFPVPRDIKSFELMTGNNQKFTQKDFYNHWTLLFFGFTHCSNVCPTTLDILNRAYGELKSLYPGLQVVLVSLDPDRDSPEAVAKYTQAFNPAFIGTTGKIQELHKLQSQLGIYAAREATVANNYQIQHTASVMLINPQGKWAGLFKFGLKPDQFVAAFKKSANTDLA